MFDDDIFEGTPEGRYFDIVFNANRNVVENELLNTIEKMSALELLLEEMLEGKDVENIIRNYIINNPEKIKERKINNIIESMGNILSQSE